ncbi:RHS repeat-associated core domain-containing protein [uncultured Paludibaculum sp.]|uniref:RHS repeat-associated core domain-containing protein n=1 Tax=uncultured Paludibaculum sp. TaxID=1765020 RepID=UPI002AAB831D|nr:RHS repeat-associated core domain-containing protein [uncultured Paludibaculum sp.]
MLNAATTGTGKIGVFDPTGLANGAYWVELRATNASGQTMTSLVLVNVAGEYKPGRVTATVTDLVVPAPGLAIRVDRTYDSLDRGRSMDFGYGWRLGLRLNMETSPTGHVTFTLNGRRRTFYFTPAANPIFQYWFVPQYTGEPGFYGKLATTGDNCSGVLRRDGNQWACGVDNEGQKYEPAGFVYTDPGGRAYTIGADGSLQSIKDLNGNTLTVTAAGISSTSGLAVPFVRDGQGRITKITDPLGHEYVYAYNAAGELAEVTYPSITTPAQYEYDTSHLLTKETDRRGNVAGTSTYYADGKLKSVTDALSNTTQYEYDPAANKTTVTNPDGGTVVTIADAYGSPLSITDPLGRVTTNTFDGNHNLLTTTNAIGKTTTYTYDAGGFRTSKKDPLGNTTSMVYNASGGPTSITDPLGHVTTGVYDAQSRPTQLSDSLGQLATVVYDSAGNITSLTNASGNTSLFTYDTQGNVLTQADALNRATTYTYDSFGNRLSAKDPRGNTTQYAYDVLNRLISTTNAAGGVVTQEHDENGNLTATVDALSHRTTYIYDAANRQTQATYPDSSTSQTTYDWRGNVLTQTDQAGRVAKYTYDLAGQVLNITAAFGTTDASTVSSTYDAAGRVLTRSDGRGNVTTSGYDDAGRLTSLQTPSGTTSFAYDASGRRTAVTDANNHTTQSDYDARGRLIKTSYADGSTTQSTYDGAGRQLTWTDQAGKITTRQYDAAGQLLTVTDAMNQATQYGYDAAGNLTTRTDANGHTTTDTFDVLNRFAGRTWPAGGTASSSSFDSAGNLLSSTDHNGKTTTYAYDLLSQLLQKTPDASLSEPAVSYTYTATGQRATMTDGSGTTTYSYDNLDRLISKATPQGTLTYTYDSNGDVTSLQSSNANGVSLGYTYDAQNRVATVVDRRQAAGLDTTVYTYDAAGNQATVTYGNGVQQTFAYDAVNRLTQAPLLKGATQFRSFSYGRAATGHILSVTENSGRSATYGFDNAWRLTSEAVASDPAGGNGLLNFGLDPANNRLSLASTLSGILAQSFSYNANDQINGETYDNNGNTLTSGGKTYGWDFENRLKSFNGGAVTMVYDGDGARVAKTTFAGTTRYLVDDLNPTGYAQVVEELQDGIVHRRYAYGPRRITETESVSGSWATHWYGYDGEGHVRTLTDATGTVTDTYDYDAFGNVVGSTGTTPNAYRYRGERWDGDLGLYYLRARWYNPVTGRFLSRDPLDTGNKYAYAAADPVNGSDPSGLLTQWTIPAVAGEALYATTVQVIVYGGAAYDAYYIGRYTTVGRDFICILKSATSAALAASELEQGYFGLVLDAYANGCQLSTPQQTKKPFCELETIPGYGEQYKCKDFVDNLKEPGDTILYYHNLPEMASDYICGADSPRVLEGFRNCRRMAVSSAGQHWALLRHTDGLVYDSYLTGPVSRGEWESLFIVEPSAYPGSTVTIGEADATGIGKIEANPIN